MFVRRRKQYGAKYKCQSKSFYPCTDGNGSQHNDTDAYAIDDTGQRECENQHEHKFKTPRKCELDNYAYAAYRR